MPIDPRFAKEVAACKRSLDYFARNYLKIRDLDGNIIPLELRSVQRRVLNGFKVNPWIYVLKARKRGISTAVAARFFWRAMFEPGFRVKLLAQSDQAAREIFGIYKTFWVNLHPAFRQQFCSVEPQAMSIRFTNGKNPSEIIAQTASGEGHRGGTVQAIHCSEFALWPNINDSIASAFNMVGDDADVILETTAKGPNEAFNIWNENNGYQKLFIGWQHDETCVRKTKPKFIPEQLRTLAKEVGLDKQQVWWGADTLLKRCTNNWNLFLQEYPTRAEDAFITSGSRFFTHYFQGAQPKQGYTQYAEPIKYHTYVVGVDTASGADVGKRFDDPKLESDFSAFCVLDVSDKKKPQIVATFYDRIRPSDFSQRVHAVALRYGALCCVEANSYGLSVIEYLINNAYPFLYRRKQHDKTNNQWAEKAGFFTDVQTRGVLMSRLSEYIERGKLAPIDPSLRFEMNTFVYLKHKPQAEKGRHDDMIFATALALVGMDQADVVDDYNQTAKKPRNLTDLLMYERRYGMLSQSETDPDADWQSPSQQLWGGR